MPVGFPLLAFLIMLFQTATPYLLFSSILMFIFQSALWFNHHPNNHTVTKLMDKSSGSEAATILAIARRHKLIVVISGTLPVSHKAQRLHAQVSMVFPAECRIPTE